MTSYLPRARRAALGACLLLGLALAPSGAAPGGVIPIPNDPLPPGTPAYVGAPAVPQPVSRATSAAAPVPRPGPRQQHPQRRLHDRRLSRTGSARASPPPCGPRSRSPSAQPHVRPPGPPGDRLRRRHHPDPEALRPHHAQAAGVVPPAQPATRRRRLQRLLRWRLLLPRPPRPGRDPDRHQPHPGRRAEPGRHCASCSGATTTSRARWRRDDKIVSVLPAWTGELVFVTERGLVGAIRPGSGAVRVLPPRRDHHQLVRRRRDRRHLRRHHRGALPARPGRGHAAR